MCCTKSTVFTRNTASQLLAIGDTVKLGMTSRKIGNDIHLCGDAIIINGVDDYRLFASVTASPTATGTIIVTAYENGVAIPGASASATVEAGELTNLAMIAPIYKACPRNSRSAITFIISGAAGTISNISVEVEKI